MGLFGGKKKELTFEEIQAAMLSPEIPDELPEWFATNKRSLLETSALKNAASFRPNSWFNVETASFFVANHIPGDCAQCANKEDVECNKCLKHGPNFFSALSAGRDGEYLIWEILLDRDSLRASGLLIIFDPSVNPDLNSKGKLAFKMQDLAPIVLGNLDVNDVSGGFGVIHVADQFATQDSDYFISGILVPSGNYVVVAWMGYNPSGNLVPMALTVYSEDFADALDEDLRTKGVLPDEIMNGVKDVEVVFARMGDNLEECASENSSFYTIHQPEDLNFLANSWIWQLIVQGENKDSFMGELLKYAEESPSGILSVVDALRLRGKKSVTFELISQLEDRFGNSLTDRDRYLIQQMKLLPAGQFVME